ncbi:MULTISPECIES: contact-dependent growth inhibition system immunity protein [unclassified Pseudomonas]|uniref:contact-dependent growth inhibition system immunity protein n=1 Tax=unclassified Pseudomonas TaxID=196821 RepID=UPI0011AF8D7C|nr:MULTISPECIES: contact-dependent growth inhibition system immunity protein [unclassified Pseudomonas]
MKKTFRSIAAGLNSTWQPEADPSSLTRWYLSVCDIPIAGLQVEDLCRAVRQELFLSELLPFVVDVLDKDLLSGFIDDGELLAAVTRLSSSYWSNDVLLAQKMRSILVKNGDSLVNEPDAVKSASILESKLISVMGRKGDRFIFC